MSYWTPAGEDDLPTRCAFATCGQASPRIQGDRAWSEHHGAGITTRIFVRQRERNSQP